MLGLNGWFNGVSGSIRRFAKQYAANNNVPESELWLMHKATWKCIKEHLSDPVDSKDITLPGIGHLCLRKDKALDIGIEKYRYLLPDKTFDELKEIILKDKK